MGVSTVVCVARMLAIGFEKEIIVFSADGRDIGVEQVADNIDQNQYLITTKTPQGGC